MPVIRSNGSSIVTGSKVSRAIDLFFKKHRFSSGYIICDENTLHCCLPRLIMSCPALSGCEIIELESGESSKSLDICNQVWQTLIEHNADGRSLIINLGGGVVSDVGGFCASVYKRGISFINIPTTLLAMADASIGGKNGINMVNTKNIIGTITQPAAVFIDTVFLETLPQRHILNGLSEIYKLALISDVKLWKDLTKKTAFDFNELIPTSVKLKSSVVSKDPLDKGTRKILNFGHTIGHALESLSQVSGDDLLHGEAVVTGMLIESHLAFQKKMISLSQLKEIEANLLRVFTLTKMQISPDALNNFLANDKKNSGSKVLYSLIKGIGKCKTGIAVTDGQLKKALQYYKTLV